MRSLFLDTCALLDAFVLSRPESPQARRLLELSAEDKGVKVFVLASSLKDMYYTFTRHYGDESKCREIIALTRRVVDIVGLTDDIVGAALESDEPDFEDGLVRAAAEMSAADLIVTRDARAFHGSPVPKATPSAALEGLIG